MKLYEVFLVPDRDASSLLSSEALAETGAQIFTPAEAELVGLQGLPNDPEGRPRLLIAFKPGDEGFIGGRLEAHEAVAQFKLHELS